MKSLALVVIVLSLAVPSNGHGRMTEPPSRASMWRLGFNNPANYNDNQLFCGGVGIQWGKYGGKCGVCGDSFEGPRDHEAPTGKYANGIIVRKYETGQEMLVRIHLTANHKGYFEFRLCQNDDPKKNVTQDCFDRNLLKNKDGVSRHPISLESPEYLPYKLVLPSGLRCKACVLQWKYNAGNSWGTFPNGTGCVGCGEQEQFYACADIAVGHDDVEVGPSSNPVVVPAGDVDERTEWKDMAERKEAERKAEIEAEVAKRMGDCTCTCTSAGSTHVPSRFIGFIFTLILKTVFWWK